MRTLEAIESDLAAARAALGQAEGTPTEVYSRIVGYYRSVRNWNRGKRAEYGDRALFELPAEPAAGGGAPRPAAPASRVLLFVRAACPACPGAKAAASKLGLPVEYVDADAVSGLEAAERHNVLSTPTAILLAADGREIARARDAGAIAALAVEYDAVASL
jgi:ribonucleoside-triphosphate reductase